MKMNRIVIAALSAGMIFLSSCGNTKVASDQIKGDWHIEEAMGVSTVGAEKEAFISFDGNGKVNGDASVNTFMGSYVFDGESLKLDNIGMTMMLGASMEIEDAITKAINSAAKIEIDGDKAVVRNDAGEQIMTLVRK